jgi:hypothetical protein
VQAEREWPCAPRFEQREFHVVRLHDASAHGGKVGSFRNAHDSHLPMTRSGGRQGPAAVVIPAGTATTEIAVLRCLRYGDFRSDIDGRCVTTGGTWSGQPGRVIPDQIRRSCCGCFLVPSGPVRVPAPPVCRICVGGRPGRGGRWGRGRRRRYGPCSLVQPLQRIHGPDLPLVASRELAKAGTGGRAQRRRQAIPNSSACIPVLPGYTATAPSSVGACGVLFCTR